MDEENRTEVTKERREVRSYTLFVHPAAPRVGHSPPFRSRYAFARSSFHSSLPAARAMSEEKE